MFSGVVTMYIYAYIHIRVCKLFQVYLYLSVYIDMFFLFTDACFHAWMMLFLWMKSTALSDVMICCFVSFGSGPMCLAGWFLTRLTWCESVLASWFVTMHTKFTVYIPWGWEKTSNKHKPFWIGWGAFDALGMPWFVLCHVARSKIMLKKHPGMILINTHSTAVEIQDFFRDLQLLMIPSENLGIIGREAWVQLFPKCCPLIAALPNK